MRLSTLELENFRNYRQARVSFKRGCTIIEGRNAAGKSNLLESLVLLSEASSPRASRDEYLIKDNAGFAHVRAVWTREERQREVQVLLQRGAVRTSKRWRVQKAAISPSEVVGQLLAVYFRPDDLDLTVRSTSHRRAYLDTLLVKKDPQLAPVLTRLQRICSQRRAALERLQQGEPVDISGFDAQLVRDGAYVSLIRRQLVAELAPLVTQIIKDVTGAGCRVRLMVTSPTLTLDPEQPLSSNTIKDAYLHAIEHMRPREIAAGRNLVGPQREDLVIELNGRLLREFGSRGEWRTLVIALKLAEIDYLENATQERPILLLDDVLSELDAQRRSALEPWFSRQQTIIATTDRHELSDKVRSNATCYTVTNGTITATTAEVAHATSRT